MQLSLDHSRVEIALQFCVQRSTGATGVRSTRVHVTIGKAGDAHGEVHLPTVLLRLFRPRRTSPIVVM